MSLLIIIKPNAKKRAEKLLEWLKSACEKRDLSYSIFETTGEFANDLAKIKVMLSQFSKAVTLGGDGTLHLTVNALMGSTCALALLPCGTGNDFSRGFSCNIVDWQHAVFNNPTEVDVGQINERYFINIAGVGFDAHVVNTLNNKTRGFAFSYSWTSFKELFYYKPKQLNGVFTQGAEQYPNLITVFANHKHFGGGLKIAPNASLTDGMVDCYQVRSGRVLCNVISFIKLFFNRHQHIKNLTYSRLSSAVINTNGLLIEADGELVGKTPAVVSVHEQALLFHIPIKKASTVK